MALRLRGRSAVDSDNPSEFKTRLWKDTEIRGCLIPKGDTAMTIQASANRDEDVFEDGENYNGLRELRTRRLATVHIIARGRTCHGEQWKPFCCQCCSSAFPTWRCLISVR